MKLFLLAASATAVLSAAVPVPTDAQVPVLPLDTVTAVADTIPDERPVPRNAFLRALVVPGLGHAYIDAPRRGGVYFGIQTASWYMLLKTAAKLNNARQIEQRLVRFGTDSLHAEMAADTALARLLSDPIRFRQALEDYPGLEDARSLVESRRRHRQDWIVYTLVFTFAAAVDAYVAAHLADFPADITVTPGSGAAVNLGVHLNVGGRRP